MFDETGLTKDHIVSLRIIIWAVAFGTVCFNITGGIAMTGYLKSLGVSDFTYGLLFAIAPAMGVAQIFISFLLERTKKRKTMFMISGLVQRLVWLPFGLVPFFVPMSAPMTRIWLASAFMILSAASGPFINVSFFSLFADITPSNIRGRYLGTRQRIATVMGILGGFMTAWLLDILPGFNGYALVFSLAALFGTIDILMFIWVKFPKMLDSEQKESIKTMLADVFSNGQFLKIVIFVTFWMFSINLSAQFYLVYTRTSLGMSNTAITLIAQILPSICSVIVLSRWGRALDKKGTRHVLMRCAKLSSFAPLLWLFVAPGWFSVILIFITYASAGLLMSGMEIGNQNAFMSRSPEKNRSMYIAVYFCITSLFGIALANTVGGWLLDNPLMVLEGFGFGAFGVVFNRYNYLFFITFLLRVGIAFGLLPRMVKE